VRNSEEYFFLSLMFSFQVLQTANREENSGDSPNLDFTLKAMQQQFERLNMVLGDMSDKMDRQDEKLANLQNDRSDDGNS